MTQRTKWLIAVVLVVVTGLPPAWGVSFARDFLHAGRTETHRADCAKAMAGIGWKLPPQGGRQECNEISDPAFETAWTGTFHLPRAEARTWLRSLPGDRSQALMGAGPDGIAEREEGLRLSIVPPAHGRIDSVDVEVQWEGQADAVVTFTTYNG